MTGPDRNGEGLVFGSEEEKIVVISIGHPPPVRHGLLENLTN